MRVSTAAYSRQIISVRSSEALSEMISSKSLKVWARIESRACRRYASPLWTGSPMLTIGPMVCVSLVVLRESTFIARHEYSMAEICHDTLKNLHRNLPSGRLPELCRDVFPNSHF